MHALWDSGYSSTLSHGMDAYLFVVLHIYFLVVESDCYNLSIQIGYGLCSKEDDDAHQHVFRCLKHEIESIVAQRIRDQQKI